MEKYTKTFYLFKHFSLVQLVKRFLFLGEKLQPTAFFQLKTVSHSITSMHKDLEATDVMTKHTSANISWFTTMFHTVFNSCRAQQN